MGLLDRSGLQLELAAVLALPRRTGTQIAVFTLRLRRVRRIRAALGDAAADSLLAAAAKRLSAFIGGASLARLDGTRFCFYRQVSGEDEACEFARGVFAAFQRPLDAQGVDVVIGVNVGIGMASLGMEGAEELMSQSGCALDRAAAASEYSVNFYTPRLRESAARRLALEAALRRAIDTHRGLRTEYQPKVGLTARNLYGVEALCRWTCAPFGIVPAGEFISIAEESELIELLGWWVLEQVCQQLLRWRAEGFVLPCVAINLSGRQLSDAELPRKILQRTARHGLAPALFEFEITESTLVADISVAAATLARIRALGFRVTLDDFGAEHSNLHYLRKLPIDSLKIDKQFVEDLADGGADDALCRAMLLLGNMLELPVIVEGIETEAQCAALIRLGFQWGQGFHFSAALPAAELADRWLTRH
ncbi:GGDEF domain-containing phosphodiesterase [Pandoraea sputorum]|uniref:Diguanylate cyclase n=1 Tax=Pandoraea sputorum TaxID=93222 RepID=A0A5E5BGQ2_9BURK|nr:GGDEF domain-containing phosphodiesterase [Pandoraea sputorum]VVE85099.1 diguanylate cyclase [Pandoraea sputorum]